MVSNFAHLLTPILMAATAWEGGWKKACQDESNA